MQWRYNKNILFSMSCLRDFRKQMHVLKHALEIETKFVLKSRGSNIHHFTISPPISREMMQLKRMLSSSVVDTPMKWRDVRNVEIGTVLYRNDTILHRVQKPTWFFFKQIIRVAPINGVFSTQLKLKAGHLLEHEYKEPP